MTNPDAGRTETPGIPDYPSRTIQRDHGYRLVPWDDWVGMRQRAVDYKRERDQTREALRKADAAAFKLTAALCALPETDDEGISRPSAMRLVVQWRTERDAALSGRKEE